MLRSDVIWPVFYLLKSPLYYPTAYLPASWLLTIDANYWAGTPISSYSLTYATSWGPLFKTWAKNGSHSHINIFGVQLNLLLTVTTLLFIARRCTRAVWKVRGLTSLFRVRTLWRCGDGLFFEVTPLANDALLTTFPPTSRKRAADRLPDLLITSKFLASELTFRGWKCL
jgi:hypothetical protein